MLGARGGVRAGGGGSTGAAGWVRSRSAWRRPASSSSALWSTSSLCSSPRPHPPHVRHGRHHLQLHDIMTLMQYVI